MPSSAITLRLQYPPAESVADPRTVNIYRTVVTDDSTDQVELYKFHHPNTGSRIGVTTFHRMNMATQKWETAGEIDWTSDTNATVLFGIESISIRDLRTPKKSSSKSRRFKASGSEYKWKIADEGVDLFCVDSRGKTVATWTEGELSLHVESRVESILDRLVVTLLLNRWMKALGSW
ncbi:hypothetical protein BV25DRAFT_1792070 [Artomyces pyxidatus]|uniref:Uncharacterized protein n=1 Tax=Artomyces pyxidatus TaxID=48021 RepID=A0ACB8TKS6_9AGAM|nr:hypothetical protein BV25DRAFT_1792070 [Artomyces pyxidatus]